MHVPNLMHAFRIFIYAFLFGFGASNGKFSFLLNFKMHNYTTG